MLAYFSYFSHWMDCGEETTPTSSFHSTEQKWLSVALQMAFIDVNALEPVLLSLVSPSPGKRNRGRRNLHRNPIDSLQL